jgi:murein DD-endopeptidase MepM/ murein hydrolase activator NlpD
MDANKSTNGLDLASKTGTMRRKMPDSAPGGVERAGSEGMAQLTSRRRGRPGPVDRIRHVFRERQLYIRSAGEVRYVTLRSSVQACGALLGVAALFWVAFATVQVGFQDQLIALKERRLKQERLDFADRIAELRAIIDQLNDRLLLDQDAYLARVEEVRVEQQLLADRHRELGEFVRRTLAGTTAAGQPSPGEDDASREAPAEREMPPALRRGSFLEPDAAMNASMVRRYAAPFRSAAAAQRPLSELRAAFAVVAREQHELLHVVELQGRAKVDAAQRILAGLGIKSKPEPARPRVALADAGGPLIPASAAALDEPTLSARMARVFDTMAEAEELNDRIRRMPIGLPMQRVLRLSSGYGLRRDPFRGFSAIHSGVDFTSFYGAPVSATAAGTVVKAGWEGAYGRLVEIEHEDGIATRYGHLQSIGVKTGDRVERGAVLGRMGTSGRSTGPHLHYEIRILGRAIDPVRFWQARDAVQKAEIQG